MSTPRHLSRVILQILAVVDPIAEATEDVIEPMIEERDKLRGIGNHLQRKAPEQIRPSQWDSAEVLLDEIIDFLDEPHAGLVEAIWTGANFDDGEVGLNWKILPINPGDRIAKCYPSWQGDDLLIRFEVEAQKDAPPGTNIRGECNRIIGSLPDSALAETEEELTDLARENLGVKR
jgi:hypothetical protein